jgi:transposase
VSKLDPTLKPEATTARRLEVITGTGRRRLFSADDKARMIEETLVPGAVISEVARRHGLSPQQLFTWRRQARQQWRRFVLVAQRLFGQKPKLVIPTSRTMAFFPKLDRRHGHLLEARSRASNGTTH